MRLREENPARPVDEASRVRDESSLPIGPESREAVQAAHTAGHPATADTRTESRARSRRTWAVTALRLVRNAAIAVAIMAVVPVGIVARYGDSFWRENYGATTRAKTVIAERGRPFALPPDPSITPMQAGQAFNALLPAPTAEAPGFRRIEPEERAVLPWDSLSITPEMFRTVGRTQAALLGVDVITAAAKGFTPEEMAYLRAIATAPLWRTFNTVARAPAADLVGGRLQLPFATSATWEAMPIAPFSQPREIAQASSARAAWFMSAGQVDSAEAALRSVVSFGFVLVDNSTSLIEQLIGDVIVGIGREQLRVFYTATGNPLAAHKGLAVVTNAEIPRTPRLSAEQIRQRMVLELNDPRVHRGERFEILHALAMSSCSNVKEMLLGPDEDVRTAMETARRSLARFPSEQAQADLLLRPLRVRSRELTGRPISQLVTSASAVAGTVLRNDRLPVCPLVVTRGFGGL
jgi:hypothetical protein